MSDEVSPKATEVIRDVAETAKNVIGEASRYEQNYTEEYGSKAVRSQTDYAHLKGIVDHYKHKGRWSYLLLALLFGMIGFQWLLLWKVGVGAWDFTKYEWLLPVVLVQNLGQIIGLAIIVVKSLFKDIK